MRDACIFNKNNFKNLTLKIQKYFVFRNVIVLNLRCRAASTYSTQ